MPEPPHSFDLSRKYRLHQDKALPWISVYGGKLTSCVPLAKATTKLLRTRLKPSAIRSTLPAAVLPRHELEEFPNLCERVPSARWCAEHEMCWSMEDYLRRRTNISQWVARGGLGFQNENAQHLTVLAKAFHGGDEDAATAAVRSYQQKIEREFDEVLARAI